MFNQTRSLAAFSFAAAMLATSVSAQAAVPNVPGCRDQANVPIVVHRVLPSKNDTAVTAARTVVAVQLARTGHIRTVALDRSSGSVAFDRVALAAARATSFAPAAHGCVAVDATFRYVVARNDANEVTAVVLR